MGKNKNQKSKKAGGTLLEESNDPDTLKVRLKFLSEIKYPLRTKVMKNMRRATINQQSSITREQLS